MAVAGQENKLAHLAGPRLLQRLQGEAWRATEHLQVAELRKPDGWLEVIHALDKHYRFLPETELHEAVEEFLFGMKRKSGEGATSFSSRFRTQLSRVQSLIAQEREMTKSKRRGKKGKRSREPNAVEPESSLEESAVSDVQRQAERPRSPSATGDETSAHAAEPARASASANLKLVVKQVILMPNMSRACIQFARVCLPLKVPSGKVNRGQGFPRLPGVPTKLIENEKIERCWKCWVHWNVVICAPSPFSHKQFSVTFT